MTEKNEPLLRHLDIMTKKITSVKASRSPLTLLRHQDIMT